jgi:hypothetical protein
MESDGGMISAAENQITRRRTCLSVILSTTNPTWTDPSADHSGLTFGLCVLKRKKRTNIGFCAKIKIVAGRRRACVVTSVDWIYIREQREMSPVMWSCTVCWVLLTALTLSSFVVSKLPILLYFHNCTYNLLAHTPLTFICASIHILNKLCAGRVNCGSMG